MATRDITANCAICGNKPKDPDSGDCPCETKALRKAIENAERKWLDSWMARIHDWVTNAAVRYITTTFAALKERRIRNYQSYVNAIPYYREYRQWHGRPPMPPHLLQQLRASLVAADRELQRGVNEDWKACVMKYPEVLDHYYNQVTVELPHGPIDTPFGGHGAPDRSGAQSVFAGSNGERKGRKGGRASAPPPGMGMFAPPPPPPPVDEMVSRRHSQRQSRRDSGSFVLSGRNKPPVAAPTPPIVPGFPSYFG